MKRKLVSLGTFRIRIRFWYNSEKSFNNNSAFHHEKATRSEEKGMNGLESAKVSANRDHFTRAPLSKTCSPSLWSSFRNNQRKMN